MRLNVYIAALLCCLTAEAAPRFTEPVWRPDLGIALPGLDRATASPFALPKASAYLVTSSTGARRLEDGALAVLKDAGEDAYVLGGIVPGDGEVLLEGLS